MSIHFPQISVIISTYNDRDLIEKKLIEIKRQTVFSKTEFIFLETGSPGKERELLEPFCGLHENCQLITFEERLSLYAAWNVGWKAAGADIVCISNMDDSMHPKLLECVLDKMAKNTFDLLTVLIAKQTLGDQDDSWDKERILKLDLSPRPGPFFAWRRSLINEFGVFDESFELSGDKEFWSRALDRGLSIGLVEKVLYLYTKHPKQLSKNPHHEKLKHADVKRMQAKSYDSAWPQSLSSRINRIRRLKQLPSWLGGCGSRIYETIP